MSYETEFPDYDDVPLMANWKGQSTWGDTSWHNDTCPSFESDNLIGGCTVRVFSDYQVPAMRECPQCERYGVVLYSDDNFCDLLRTNSATEVEHLIRALESVWQILYKGDKS